MNVKVSIRDKNRYIGAMVKALAFEIDGPKSVKGSSKDILEAEGCYIFHFSNNDKAQRFLKVLSQHLPGYLAEAVSEA